MDEALQQVVEAPVEQSAPSEKMLAQSEVNSIVGRVKQEAAAKAVEEYKRTQQQAQPQQPAQVSNQQQEIDAYVRKLAVEEIQRQKEEWVNEAQNHSNEQAAQNVVKNFYDKMNAGKQRYEDFDTVTANVPLTDFPNVVQMLAESVDNAADVMYDLAKNPEKLFDLEMAAEAKGGKYRSIALQKLKRLADSIKSNDNAGNYREAKAPLHQQRPSNTGTDGGAVLSMRDLKNKYRG